MRRLSIIDLAGGHQPMSNEDDTIWVVFNGEIYNYQDLRQNLIAQGHRFETDSDTETLLHLYEQEGVEGIARLRGMFAYAIWDARHRQLLLARDRFGKKPLYYAAHPTGFYFGSELKCLRAAGVPLESDDEALQLYLQFGYVPDPWSAFRACASCRRDRWLTWMPGGASRQALTGSCRRRAKTDAASFRGRDLRGDPRAVRRIGAAADDRRRAAGRVSERRHRFQPGGGLHGSAIVAAGAHLFDRL